MSNRTQTGIPVLTKEEKAAPEEVEATKEAAQRLKSCNDVISEALESSMQGVTAVLAEAMGMSAGARSPAEIITPALEKKVFAVFEQLARRAAYATSSLHDAHEASTRKKLKAQSSAMELKLNVQRKASQKQLENHHVELQANYDKKLADTIKELVQGDGAAMAAMNRADELEEKCGKLQNEVTRLRELTGVAQAKVQALEEAVAEAKNREWTLEARGAEAEARITELSEELARTDAPALRKKLDESEKRREKLESDFETTKMQLASAHARNTREQEMAMAECNLLNEGLTATREAQAVAEAEAALLREEMERVRAEERSTAQEKERLAHEKVEVMQGTMTMMGKDLHAAQEALRQARADIQGYQNTIREVANRQQSAVNEEMEELKDKLEAAQARTSTLQALLQEEKTIMLGKVEQLSQRTKEVLALEKRLQVVTAERDKRESLVTQLQAELDAGLERHGVELRDRITRLEHELDASKAVAGQTIAELSTRIEALSAEIEPAKALAASGADLVEQLRQARSDLEGARRGDKTWEVVGRLQRDMEGAKAIARGLLSEDEAGVVRPAGMCAHLEAVVKSSQVKIRQATDLLERTRIALRQATEALEHAERANRAERSLLSTSAIMGLKQLSVHLTYTLSGLRIGEERPTGEPSASVLAIKQLSFSQSVPVLPSAAPSVPSRRRVWAVSGEPIPRLLMPQPPGARNLLQGRSAVQYVEKAEAKVEATIDRSGLIEYPGLMATVEQAAAADEEKAAAKGGGSPRTVGLSRNRDSVEVHSYPGSPQGSPTGSKTRFLDSPTGPNKKITSPRSKPSPTSPRGSVAVGTAALAGSVAMSGVVINGPVAGAAGLVKGPTLGGGMTIGAATGVVPLGNATGCSPSPIGARTRQEVVDEVAAAHREVRQALRAAKAVEAAMMQVLPEPLPDVHATRRMPSKPLGGGSPIKPTGISLSPPSSRPPPPSKQPKRQMQSSTATGLPALPPAASISLTIQGDPKELAVTG